MGQNQTLKLFNLFGGLSLLSLIVTVTFLHTTSAKLYIFENAERLDSSIEEINYPQNNETLDVIWLFNHSIRLHLDKFHVDGHSGDFLLVSDQPLLDSDYFKDLVEKDPSNEGYINDLARSTVTDQGLLLSWKMKNTLEAVNERGTFVLFHAEPKIPEKLLQFEGIDITVVNYDHAVSTTPPTTPDPYVTAKPGQESPYITKYLDCKPPLQFIKELDHFKETIARIATKYCIENKVPICLERGNITKEDVNVPGRDQGQYAGLHYCDPTWSNYAACVEIKFAITRTDINGNYILTSNHLEKMWAAKTNENELRKNRYCPYDPPAPKFDMNTIVWIAFFLGIILTLTAILGFAWINNMRTLLYYRRSFAKDKAGSDSIDNRREIPNLDEKPQKSVYDVKNPIYTYIQKSNFSRDDQLYPSGNYLAPDEGDNDSVALRLDNPTFQNIEADVYAYDNSGFEQEEALYATSNRNDGRQVYMRSHFPSQSETET